MENDYWLNRIRTEVMPVLQEKIGIEKVFLFGSRAKGGYQEDSDIDLIIISHKFENIPVLKRMTTVLKLLRFPKHLDILCYTPKEFEEIQKTSAIVRDAMINSYTVT